MIDLFFQNYLPPYSQLFLSTGVDSDLYVSGDYISWQILVLLI